MEDGSMAIAWLIKTALDLLMKAASVVIKFFRT